ncbi:MAG: hypothetical protein OHK0019_18180 [Saprospiraceae bacterium]
MKALEASQIVLMLVSADSLFSDFIQRKELKKALEQKQEGVTRIIPILVRDCLYEMAEGISDLQMLPLHLVSHSLAAVDDLATWGSRCSAWATALRQLHEVILEVHARIEADEKEAALAAEAQRAKEAEKKKREEEARRADPFHDLMVYIKGGTFDMGDTFGDGGDSEKPVHRVTVRDFYLCKYTP